MKKNIIIVGGGIGGLSCATALAETQQFNISIYESELLGGQASSKKSKLCNTEISWRVFGVYYINLGAIFKTLDIEKNFYPLKSPDACINDNKLSPVHKPISSMIKNCNMEQINKILKVFFLSKDRAINEYHHINAYNYFNSEFMNLIMGPYMGLEPSKISLSTYYKFFYALFEKKTDSKSTGLTKYPTNDAVFKPWRKYLEKLGVKIYENTKVQELITNKQGHIKKIVVNNKILEADEIVLALSLQSLIKMFKRNQYLYQKPLFIKLNYLSKGLQFYITVNFYFKKVIIPSRTCHIYTFLDGWMPIILKRFIETDYTKNNCHKNIKEVWNIGLVDYIPGKYIKKFTSQCTKEELIYEIKMNLINSPHFKKFFKFEEQTWDDIFFGYEFDDRYYKNSPTTYKFSINKTVEKNLLNNQELELGNHVYFSNYLVKNSVGGASMETSCEIGLTTANLICKKYNIYNSRKPIYKTKIYLKKIFYPLVKFDSFLYAYNLPPITKYINPIILLVLYFLLLIGLVICLIYFIYQKSNLKMLSKKIITIKNIKNKKK